MSTERGPRLKSKADLVRKRKSLTSSAKVEKVRRKALGAEKKSHQLFAWKSKATGSGYSLKIYPSKTENQYSPIRPGIGSPGSHDSPSKSRLACFINCAVSHISLTDHNSISLSDIQGGPVGDLWCNKASAIRD